MNKLYKIDYIVIKMYELQPNATRMNVSSMVFNQKSKSRRLYLVYPFYKQKIMYCLGKQDFYKMQKTEIQSSG